MRLLAKPSKKHLRTPPSTVRGRRTEIALIGDPASRCSTFCKRRGTLFSKASELCELAGARAAVIVFSRTGKLYPSGDLSVEETAQIISDYVSCNGGAMPPVGLKEKADWVKKQRRRTEIAKSADRVRMLRSFSNRLETLCNKATELCTKTDARAAVIVFPNTGSLYSDTEIPYCFGIPTVEDIISHWVEKQLKSCVTKEDFDSLNLKYEPVLHYVMREKLKDISGSGNSGVGVDRGSEVSKDDDIDSRAQSFEGSHSVLLADLKDHVRDDFLTSPVNSAVGSGSLEKESVRSVPLGCEFNPHSSLNLSENNPSVKAGAGGVSGVGVGHDDEVLYDDDDDDDDDWIHSLPEIFEVTCPSLLADFGNCNRNGDSDSFSTSPVNLAVAGGSSGVEPTSTPSDLEVREFVDSLLNLSGDLVREGYLIPPEKSTVHGGSSVEEHDLNIYSALENLNISLEI